jgi:hypothetical protein
MKLLRIPLSLFFLLLHTWTQVGRGENKSRYGLVGQASDVQTVQSLDLEDGWGLSNSAKVDPRRIKISTSPIWLSWNCFHIDSLSVIRPLNAMYIEGTERGDRAKVSCVSLKWGNSHDMVHLPSFWACLFPDWRTQASRQRNWTPHKP